MTKAVEVVEIHRDSVVLRFAGSHPEMRNLRKGESVLLMTGHPVDARLTNDLQKVGDWERPDHYGGEENPFEPIKIIEHYGLNFHLGNALKYILRTGKKKGEPNLKELKKAYTYIGFEIRRRIKLGEEDA